MSSNPEEEACLGRFFNFTDKHEASWMTLISPDNIDDIDYMGGQLKYLKRQLKRAFPELVDSIEKERISLEMNSFGHVALNLKNKNQIPKVNNLYLASPLLQEKQGWSGILESVKDTFEHYQPHS